MKRIREQEKKPTAKEKSGRSDRERLEAMRSAKKRNDERLHRWQEERNNGCRNSDG